MKVQWKLVQADVEEHIGGPDAEVEPALVRLQDALAYVDPSPALCTNDD